MPDSLYHQIWEAALRKIEKRSHSSQELINKLEVQFPQDRGLILKTVEEMQRVHLLNDRRFTEEYVAHLTQKNIGRLKIFQETRKRGLNNDEVEQVLLDIGWAEDDAAKRAIEEKSRLIDHLDERKKKQKLMNFLKNRGFSDRVIYSNLSGKW